MCITSSWWTVGAGAITSRYARNPRDWQCSPQSCREENSEAFAGQHQARSTSFYIFDEASAIPDKIFEVAEGGLTDGEPMIFLLGNPTRNEGKFYRLCFGHERNRWYSRSIDSRNARPSCRTPERRRKLSHQLSATRQSELPSDGTSGLPKNMRQIKFCA
jgi:hypothetical protein